MDRKTYRAKWYQDNKERTQGVHRRWHYKTRYGITPEEYDTILKEQNNVCAICKNPETAKEHRTGNVRKLAIDHCHTTNKVRGLLCASCNQGLGKFKDSINLLENAIKYIKES